MTRANHRVIKDFMIQGGDPDSKRAPMGKILGTGGPDYTIDAEFVYPQLFHKRGALSAARLDDEINPERKSSGSQFYIIWGKTYTPNGETDGNADGANRIRTVGKGASLKDLGKRMFAFSKLEIPVTAITSLL